jgi:signal transduction histidine kinase/ligand-binding sensor domain-containing protein/DNA-binding response OmpR family regulator
MSFENRLLGVAPIELKEVRLIRLILLFIATSLFLIVSITNGQESNLYFENFKVKDGLPDNSVLSVTQDNRGYIWIVTKNGLCRYDGMNFKVFKHEQNNNGSISDNGSTGVVTDHKGQLWVISKELELYHPENETFQKIPTGLSINKTIFFDHQDRLYVGGLGCLKYFEGGNLQTAKTFSLNIDVNTLISVIYEDGQHNLWVGTTRGLFKIDPSRQQTSSFQKKVAADLLGDDDITTVVQDKNQDLWIGTRTTGVYRYNRQSNSIESFKKSKTSENGPIGNHIRKIINAKDGTIWIGTQEGLSIYNIDGRKFYNFQKDPTDQHSLSHNSIYEIFQDRAGSIWIGAYFGGLNVVHLGSAPFKIFQNNGYKNSISSNIISAIAEDAHHNLWIGTDGGGLNFWNKQTGRFTIFKNDGDDKRSLSSNLVKAIAFDQDGDVYIGTSTGGLNIYHPSTGKFENHWYSRQKTIPVINGDDVKCLLVTNNNEVLVGTNAGLLKFSKKEQSFSISDTSAKSKIWVTTLYEDKQHTIWIGTPHGLYEMTASRQIRQASFFDSSKAHNPFTFEVICLQEDQFGRLWAGTLHKGLVLLDQKKNSYHVFNEQDGLPADNVVGILSDAHNNLWISTNNGLAKFDVAHGHFQNLTVEDGLPDNQFNRGSFYKQNDSCFYFGTYNGLINFNPNKITQNEIPPKVIFSYVRLFNQTLNIDQQHQLLDGDLNNTQGLTFKYNQNVFTIGFAALNFVKSPKNRYAYRLTGFDRDWSNVNFPEATYTNLPPGNYQLQVKAANNDGIWNQEPAVLNIQILPAPWKTWWAYTSYLIILVIILAYVRHFLRARTQLRQELYRERIEAEHEKKSHQQQLEFFTNISHEIRTPLTLILGPLERLANSKMDISQTQQYNSIKNNANRLYRLVTELLDFRKAGTDQLKLYFCEEDIVKFLREIYGAFESTAEIKGISFQFNSAVPSLMVFFDRDQLEKVFNNLLINAIKFTPAGGQVKVGVTEHKAGNQVQIVVEDNGKGIQHEDLDNIFENFYQAGPSIGTGIGLALSKRLIELHKGTIKVQSKNADNEQEGLTAFTVLLKLGREHLPDEQVIVSDSAARDNLFYPNTEPNDTFILKSNQPVANVGDHTILLVEDNDEVREFIRQSLEKDYKVIEAKNGEEGLEQATQQIPDLIISDVMMPIMDGVEFCSRVKADIRTCHIPVILLTAKSAPIHQIHGLQHGADAYITKPFSTQVLNLNISNMLRLIGAQQQKYSDRLILGPLPVRHSESEDEKLLDRLQEIIQLNMSNSDFDVVAISRQVGMSKSLLYKKFSALTNLSLNNFIKMERLKKAVTLFKGGETSVMAVAVEVGFNDVKYFSKEFKKIYNITPNEYLNGGAEWPTDVN